MTSKNPIKDSDDFWFHSDIDYIAKKQWLKDFIKREFNLNIPDKKICGIHDAPMDFIAEVAFQRVKSALVLANRDGGKTYDFALLHAINGRFYDGCESISVGAVEEQAKKCYSYYKQFIKASTFKDIYQDPLTMESTLKNGSILKVAPGTLNALNSPHPNKSFFDEIELTKPAVLQEFFSMAKSDLSKGLTTSDILGSTRKYSYGIMQQLIDSINSNEMIGWKIYQWCIWEVIERFELKEEWKKIVKHTKDGEISFYDIAKPYAGRTCGFFSIDDTISKFSNMSYDTWLTQWECKKPSKEGLVYGGEFDESVDILPRPWIYNPAYPVYCGQDFGDQDPMVTLFYQLLPDGKTMVLFDEVHDNKITASSYAKNYLIPRRLKYKSQAWIVHDPSGAGYAREMKAARDDEDHSIGAMLPAQKQTVDEGVQLVKTMHESHRIKVSPNCVHYIKEKRNYHYLPGTDKIADEFNHCMDPERYVMVKLFGAKEKDPQRKIYGMPSISSSHNRII